MRVLVCDDEPFARKLAEVTLRRAGHEVECVEDGAACLHRLAQRRFDLLVLDVVMPVLDGLEVLRQIRSNPHTAELPVAMVTARAQPSELQEAWDAGATFVLAKPFEPRDLVLGVERRAA